MELSNVLVSLLNDSAQEGIISYLKEKSEKKKYLKKFGNFSKQDIPSIINQFIEAKINAGVSLASSTTAKSLLSKRCNDSKYNYKIMNVKNTTVALEYFGDSFVSLLYVCGNGKSLSVYSNDLQQMYDFINSSN